MLPRVEKATVVQVKPSTCPECGHPTGTPALFVAGGIIDLCRSGMHRLPQHELEAAA